MGHARDADSLATAMDADLAALRRAADSSAARAVLISRGTSPRW
ncbi:MAG: hypothetical protein U0133_04345 [Gemmatimonadales bacterium]